MPVHTFLYMNCIMRAGSIESLDSVLRQVWHSIKSCLYLSPCMKMLHLNLQAFNLFL